MAFTADQQREYRRARKEVGDRVPSGSRSKTSGKSTKSGKTKLRQIEDSTERKLAVLSQKKFCAWDSEGVNYLDENGIIEHRTAFFANSMGDEYRRNDGLAWHECASELIPWLYSTAKKYPHLQHVFFSASYDWTMILRGLPLEILEEIHKKEGKRGTLVYIGKDRYDIKISRRRMLTIRKFARWETRRRKDGKEYSKAVFDGSVSFVDCFGFYQQSFVAAIEHNLGSDYVDLPIIKEGKKQRGADSRLTDECVVYCRAELTALVSLCEKLRDELVLCRIPIRNFWGAGAIASAMLSEGGMAQHINPHNVTMAIGDYSVKVSPLPPTRPSLGDALLYSFAGARIEMVRYGYCNSVHDYDMNSCYPFFLSRLPSFNTERGFWRYRDGLSIDDLDSLAPVSIISTFFEGRKNAPFYPLFYRGPNHSIYYPRSCAGWYFKHEVVAAKNAVGICAPERLDITCAWEWVTAESHSPWKEYITEKFNFRKKLKSLYGKGGPEKQLKLGLNSLYGKTAQRVGYEWKFEDGQSKLKMPRYHDLCIAGYITSSARAALYSLAAQNPRAIISFATDGLTSSKPLECDNVGAEIGQWEYISYDEGYFLQPGMYMLFKEGKEKIMTRGFRPKMSGRQWADLVKQVWENGGTDILMQQECFYTLGLALARQQPLDKIGQWEMVDRKIMLHTLGSKRVACEDGSEPHKRLVKTKVAPLNLFCFDVNAHASICGLNARNRLLPMSYPSPAKWLTDKPESMLEYELSIQADEIACMQGESFDSIA